MRPTSLGNWGENLALKYLKKKGYRFLTRNFRCRLGEIDLIMKDKDSLVFIEVKTRYSQTYGQPETAVTPRKIRSLVKTAHYFKLLHPKQPDLLRIDVVAIGLNENRRLAWLKHFKNITLSF